MCGRFTLTADPDQLRQVFPWLNIPIDIEPRYNVAPSQPVAVIPNDGNNRLDFYKWGLVPSWSKDPKIGNRMINARAETVHEKPSFRSAFRRRRCLIPANGFYEWKREEGSNVKTPMYVTMKSGQPFAFAGLWEIWQSPEGGELPTCTIITTRPNIFMEDIHNRMPVILPVDGYELWLDPGEPDLEQLKTLLQPYPSEEMMAFPVSRVVNNPANDTEACIQPIAS